MIKGLFLWWCDVYDWEWLDWDWEYEENVEDPNVTWQLWIKDHGHWWERRVTWDGNMWGGGRWAVGHCGCSCITWITTSAKDLSKMQLIIQVQVIIISYTLFIFVSSYGHHFSPSCLQFLNCCLSHWVICKSFIDYIKSTLSSNALRDEIIYHIHFNWLTWEPHFGSWPIPFLSQGGKVERTR